MQKIITGKKYRHFKGTSSTLSMRVKRNPDIKAHSKKYNEWKDQYPIQMKNYENNEITKETANPSQVRMIR